MMYVSQILMWYPLSLYSAVCQFYLNKTEKNPTTTLYQPQDGKAGTGVAPVMRVTCPVSSGDRSLRCWDGPEPCL